MSKIVGSSHKEIAAHLDRPAGTVRVLLHRAMAKLGVLLDDADS